MSTVEEVGGVKATCTHGTHLGAAAYKHLADRSDSAFGRDSKDLAGKAP